MARRKKLLDKHVRFARSDEYLATYKFSRKGAQALANELAEAKRLGVSVEYKIIERGWWSTFSTTLLSFGIRLEPEMRKAAEWQRARLIRHELTHSRQWRGLGRFVFAIRYADPRWRWALEMQAFRGDIRALVETHARKEYCEGEIKRCAEMLTNVHKIRRVDGRQMHDLTIKLLREELNRKA